MSGAPQVSIIVPTFNRHAAVTEAIESARQQTLPDIEIVVVDDGSTDGTADALRAAFSDEPRLRVLEQANAGCAAARNAGVAAAHAPLIAFLDSDDLLDPGYLASQLQILEADSEAAGAFCDGRFGPGWAQAERTVFEVHGQGAPRHLDDVVGGGPATIVSLLIRTEVARAVRFDEQLACREDLDFMARLVLAGHRLAENREVLWTYRHGTQVDGHPQKSNRWLPVHRSLVTLLTRIRDAVTDPRVVDDQLRELHHNLAHHHWRTGDRRAARPHCRALARLGPRRMHWRRRYLRSFLPGA